MKKLSVGYQLTEQYEFIDCVESFNENIDEIYFPWLGISDGRGRSVSGLDALTIMQEDLSHCKHMGKRLNVLFNSTCYGGKELTNSFLRQISSILEFLLTNIGLDSITTTSLFIAKNVKKSFPDLDVRASVNININTVQQMEFLKNYFDSFYAGRAVNRNLEHVKEMYSWCQEKEKKLYLLANSGCLKNCPAHMYHDNLVAHEHEIVASNDFCEPFHGICWEWYSGQKDAQPFIDNSTWIRPEDVHLFSSITDGVKLATRTHADPLMVISSYANGKHQGNMLRLCEPDHSGLFFLDNSQIKPGYLKR